jgi:hypothetical protein
MWRTAPPPQVAAAAAAALDAAAAALPAAAALEALAPKLPATKEEAKRWVGGPNTACKSKHINHLALGNSLNLGIKPLKSCSY